jgi:zinc transporter ZupT
MAVRALPHNGITVHQAVEQKSARLATGHKPRRCMVVSTGLVLAGLGIPLLMAVGVLPISLLLGFMGFILAGAGGLMLLIFCGEI